MQKMINLYCNFTICYATVSSDKRKKTRMSTFIKTKLTKQQKIFGELFAKFYIYKTNLFSIMTKLNKKVKQALSFAKTCTNESLKYIQKIFKNFFKNSK